MFKNTPLNVIVTHFILWNLIFYRGIILILLNKTTPIPSTHILQTPPPEKHQPIRTCKKQSVFSYWLKSAGRYPNTFFFFCGLVTNFSSSIKTLQHLKSVNGICLNRSSSFYVQKRRQTFCPLRPLHTAFSQHSPFTRSVAKTLTDRTA